MQIGVTSRACRKLDHLLYEQSVTNDLCGASEASWTDWKRGHGSGVQDGGETANGRFRREVERVGRERRFIAADIGPDSRTLELVLGKYRAIRHYYLTAF